MRSRFDDLAAPSALWMTMLALALSAVPAAALPTTGAEAFGPEARGFRSAAWDVVQQSGDLVGAADYLVETARGLSADDPDRAANLQLASRFYYAAGRLGATYATLIDAASAAFSVGQSTNAAHMLIDAGIVAVEDGEPGAAQRAADKAGYVVRVSDLTPEQRAAVLRRVEYATG